MRPFRNIFIGLGIVLILAAAFSAWRSAHPTQTDEQILRANLDDAVNAIQDRSAARVSKYFGPSFSWNGTPRSEINRMMTGAFWQWRDVQLQLSNQHVQLKGDMATTSGHFFLSYRPAPNAAPENHSGDFSLQWQKQDGQWKVTSASGDGNFNGGSLSGGDMGGYFG